MLRAGHSRLPRRPADKAPRTECSNRDRLRPSPAGNPPGQCQQMMIEIAQPPVAKPDRHHTVAGFPLHEAGGRARGVARNSWRSACLVLHSVLPLVEFFKRFDGLVTPVAGPPLSRTTIIQIVTNAPSWSMVSQRRTRSSCSSPGSPACQITARPDRTMTGAVRTAIKPRLNPAEREREQPVPHIGALRFPGDLVLAGCLDRRLTCSSRRSMLQPTWEMSVNHCDRYSSPCASPSQAPF